MRNMRRLSDETFDLLRQLYQPSGLFGKLLSNQAKPSDLLNRIDQTAESAVIPHLLQYAIRNRNENGETAARIIHNRIEELSVSGLAGLDEQIRRTGIEYPQYWGWTELRPEEIGNISHLSGYKVSMLGVSSFHNNGYIRERAISKLNNSRTGQELAYLLIRLNDWVSNVREAAAAAVTSRLTPEYAGFFVECLPLILRLSKRQRIVQSSLVSSITQLLQNNAARPALLSGLQSQDRYVRRACYKIAYEVSDIDLAAIIELGIKDQDTQIRLWSAQAARKLKDSSDVARLLVVLEKDGFMPIRLEALRIYLTDFPVLATDKLKEALLDTHPAIRDEARYHISKREKMDFAAFYRDALGRDEVLYAAISGLGEVGNVSDGQLILPYVNHPHNRIRFATLRALSRIGPKEYIDTFINALFDSSPRVSREAMNALIQSGHSVSGQRLWELFPKASYFHTTKHTLALMARLPKWDSIYYLIKAASSPDEQISFMAKQLVENWVSHFNSSFVAPTAIQKVNLAMTLDESAGILGKTIQRQIEFMMKGF